MMETVILVLKNNRQLSAIYHAIKGSIGFYIMLVVMVSTNWLSYQYSTAVIETNLVTPELLAKLLIDYIRNQLIAWTFIAVVFQPVNYIRALLDTK